MENNKSISAALGVAAARFGSNAQFGRIIGIHGATIGKYRNGLIDQISDDHYEKMYPYMKDALPGNDPRYWPRSKLVETAVMEDASNYGESRKVPLYSMSNATRLTNDLFYGEPVSRKDEANDTIETTCGESVAAFRVVGSSMTGSKIFDGDIVECRKVYNVESLRTGAIVVAKVAGSAIIKKWLPAGDSVVLDSTGDGDALTVKTDLIEWVLEVIRVVRTFERR